MEQTNKVEAMKAAHEARRNGDHAEAERLGDNWTAPSVPGSTSPADNGAFAVDREPIYTPRQNRIGGSHDGGTGGGGSPGIDPILRRPAVEAATGLATSTIYARMKSGTFPKPIQLGPNAVGWRKSAIEAWLDECEANSAEAPEAA